MKIVTWNCNGALRKKTDRLDELQADLYVVQECENPDASTKQFREWAKSYLWCGQNKNKGIGVFAKNGLSLQKLNWSRSIELPCVRTSSALASWHTSELNEFLPFRVNDKFNVVAVWTKHSPGGTFGYAGQLWKYFQCHGEDIGKGECVLLGDLNSNVQWDRSDRWWNHGDNVRILDSLGLKSLYHEQKSLEQGCETDSTFFLYRHREKSYHIDYVFLSDVLRRGVR